MNWTPEQQKVIDTRNKNILVSAAAGSGKTAVLVERIIAMITNTEKPVDIDHLLIVTFTNAAAAQMREKIGKAIEERLIKEPDNLHLQKQMTLLPSAQITTIHSFCLNVIRNYFNMIDLDPSFKMADETEITLMKSDVIENLLERYYEEGREDFLKFIESYSHSKSDTLVEELILKLYSFCISYPWPKKWLMEKQKAFELNKFEDLNKTEWMLELILYCRNMIEIQYERNARAISICQEAAGPLQYLPALLSDRELLEQLLKFSTYEEYEKALSELSFARLSSKRDENVDTAKKECVKALREELKKVLTDLKNQFFFQSPENMLLDLSSVKEVMQVLFELVVDFMDAFEKKKEEKNVIDFNDIEHFALRILVKEQEGEIHPTAAAMELCEHFDEILIDEYQDSNLVQETILTSISRERLNTPNRFMVGDVKQSIYKFRLAMPELFMEKYNTYSCEDFTKDGNTNYYQRINLDRNFRSREVVLDYVNMIFQQIMIKSVGGIDYDKEAELKAGLEYGETQDSERISKDVELILVLEESDKEEEDSARQEVTRNTVSEEEAIYTSRELEAKAVAKRIKELVDPDSGMLVYDDKKKAYRPAEYSDIVILLRTISGWSEVFVGTLMQEGIPAYADTSTGYFQTVEITTLINLLKIIDNPKQDIPLTGVLHSPIVSITGRELALIKAASPDKSMYSAILSYSKEGTEAVLVEKLHYFLDLIEEFREMVPYTPIHELLYTILDKTGYHYFVLSMPSGEQRKANIDMLISHAVHFEQSSYSGLFQFIRYIEKLNKYDIDFGEAVAAGEQDATIRIMSIHKSKGLEFPIVIVAGMGKQFNTQDLKSKIILHADYGAGPEYINLENRTRIPTLLKKVIQKKVQIESLGEELRVLYVAMTRAKEKLIMTGYIKSIDQVGKQELSFYDLVSANSYLDWVIPAMANQMENSADGFISNMMTFRILPKEKFITEEMKQQVFEHADKEELQSIRPEEIYDSSIREELKKELYFEYPYQKDAGLHVKMSVSELKKKSQQIDEEEGEVLFKPGIAQDEYQKPDPKESKFIPDFIRKEEVIAGTDRGTLYHKVLELIDYAKVNTMEDLNLELNLLVNSNRILKTDIELLNLKHVEAFLKSNVAERMRKAQAQGKLFKEKQFVIGMKASDINPELTSEELILIQGIVDVFFEEEGELVLLDYKSDVVNQDGEAILIKRYQVQMDYYQRALEQITGKRVKEKLIYSLNLEKEIPVD